MKKYFRSIVSDGSSLGFLSNVLIKTNVVISIQNPVVISLNRCSVLFVCGSYYSYVDWSVVFVCGRCEHSCASKTNPSLTSKSNSEYSINFTILWNFNKVVFYIVINLNSNWKICLGMIFCFFWKVIESQFEVHSKSIRIINRCANAS